MPYNFFQPKPGRFGVHPVPFNSGRLNTGTLPTAGNQDHNIGGYPGKMYINKANVSAETYPNVATSCTIQLFKLVPGSSPVTLSAAININNLTADAVTTIPITATLTDGQRTMQPGESIRVRIATGGAPTSSGDDLVVTIEGLVIE